MAALDGNAIAGTLVAIFDTELTAATGGCASCGRRSPLGEFAVWAGHKRHITSAVVKALADSCRYGREHLEDIVKIDGAARGISETLARDYLTHHIVNELGPREYEGLELYLRYAREALVAV